MRSILIVLLLTACGGSGGGSTQQGDRPVGDGNNVQKSTARVTVHGAAGDVTTNYVKEKP